MQPNSVEVIGGIDLIDLPDVVAPDPGAHERIRASRLADVMIVLERDAAEIAQAIGERLAARWPNVREAHVDLAIADDAPAFKALASAAHDPGTDPVTPESLRAALTEVVEAEITEAIRRRAAVNRRFAPRIQLVHQPPASSAQGDATQPPETPQPTQPVTAATGEALLIRTRAVQSLAPAGRFWLLVVFALIAALLFTAAALFTMQPG